MPSGNSSVLHARQQQPEQRRAEQHAGDHLADHRRLAELDRDQADQPEHHEDHHDGEEERRRRFGRAHRVSSGEVGRCRGLGDGRRAPCTCRRRAGRSCARRLPSGRGPRATPSGARSVPGTAGREQRRAAVGDRARVPGRRGEAEPAQHLARHDAHGQRGEPAGRAGAVLRDAERDEVVLRGLGQRANPGS